MQEAIKLEVPITSRHRVELLKIYVLPTLTLPCILGVDFLSLFGVGVNFATYCWYFAENSNIEYDFDRKSGDSSCRVKTPRGEDAKQIENGFRKSGENPASGERTANRH